MMNAPHGGSPCRDGAARWSACRYIRTGTNHYSLAFTYDWMARAQERRSWDGFIHPFDDDDDSMRPIMYGAIPAMRNETGIDFPSRRRSRYLFGEPF